MSKCVVCRLPSLCSKVKRKLITDWNITLSCFNEKKRRMYEALAVSLNNKQEQTATPKMVGIYVNIPFAMFSRECTFKKFIDWRRKIEVVFQSTDLADPLSWEMEKRPAFLKKQYQHINITKAYLFHQKRLSKW